MNPPVWLRDEVVPEATGIATSHRSSFGYNAGLMVSDLSLCILDFLCLFIAAAVSTAVYAHSPGALVVDTDPFDHAPWIAGVLAPFILYDRRFGTLSPGRARAFVRPFAVRFTLLAVIVLTIGAVTQSLQRYPALWLVVWFSGSLLLMLLSRVLVTTAVRSLQRRGAMAEVIAVVGAGPVADRLVNALRQNRPDTVELLGIFDDRFARTDDSIAPIGNLAQLIDLGKTRKIDWILLTLPPTAEHRLHAIMKRLMSLSAPIGLCPQHIGSTLPYRVVDYAADAVPVSLLADRPLARWDAFERTAEHLLPRWTVTFALRPLRPLVERIAMIARRRTTPALVVQFDDYDLERFAEKAATFGQERCGYVVTPNVDHIVRLHEDPDFRAVYAAADFVLLDSRFLSHLLRVTQRSRLSVCAGSDLTAKLFDDVIAPDDKLVVIGGTPEQLDQLRDRYGLRNAAHFYPPMGFIANPAEVERCLAFIETHSPFRFCVLAVGTPQQELLGHMLKARGAARGLVLCVGASINFLTGVEQRAPLWMRRSGLEWLFRLAHSPARLAHRYLVRGPRVFGLLRRSRITLRKAPLPVRNIATTSPAPLPPFPDTDHARAARVQEERPRISSAS